MCCSTHPLARVLGAAMVPALFLLSLEHRHLAAVQFLLACPTAYWKATVAFTFSVASRKGEWP